MDEFSLLENADLSQVTMPMESAQLLSFVPQDSIIKPHYITYENNNVQSEFLQTNFVFNDNDFLKTPTSLSAYDSYKMA